MHGVAVLVSQARWEHTHPGTGTGVGYTYPGTALAVLRCVLASICVCVEYLQAVYTHLLQSLGISAHSPNPGHTHPCSEEYRAGLPAGYTPERSPEGRVICTAYNLLLTEQWMMVVSRRTNVASAQDTAVGVGISVNGFGFAGLLLVRGLEPGDSGFE